MARQLLAASQACCLRSHSRSRHLHRPAASLARAPSSSLALAAAEARAPCCALQQRRSLSNLDYAVLHTNSSVFKSREIGLQSLLNLKPAADSLLARVLHGGSPTSQSSKLIPSSDTTHLEHVAATHPHLVRLKDLMSARIGDSLQSQAALQARCASLSNTGWIGSVVGVAGSDVISSWLAEWQGALASANNFAGNSHRCLMLGMKRTATYRLDDAQLKLYNQYKQQLQCDEKQGVSDTSRLMQLLTQDAAAQMGHTIFAHALEGVEPYDVRALAAHAASDQPIALGTGQFGAHGDGPARFYNALHSAASMLAIGMMDNTCRASQLAILLDMAFIAAYFKRPRAVLHSLSRASHIMTSLSAHNAVPHTLALPFVQLLGCLMLICQELSYKRASQYVGHAARHLIHTHAELAESLNNELMLDHGKWALDPDLMQELQLFAVAASLDNDSGSSFKRTSAHSVDELIKEVVPQGVSVSQHLENGTTAPAASLRKVIASLQQQNKGRHVLGREAASLNILKAISSPSQDYRFSHLQMALDCLVVHENADDVIDELGTCLYTSTDMLSGKPMEAFDVVMRSFKLDTLQPLLFLHACSKMGDVRRESSMATLTAISLMSSTSTAPLWHALFLFSDSFVLSQARAKASILSVCFTLVYGDFFSELEFESKARSVEEAMWFLREFGAIVPIIPHDHMREHVLESAKQLRTFWLDYQHSVVARRTLERFKFW